MSIGEAGTEGQTAKAAWMRGGAASGGQGGAVYGLGMIGALVYYWRHAEGGAGRAGAVGKAVLWPAFLVHDQLEHLSDR